MRCTTNGLSRVLLLACLALMLAIPVMADGPVEGGSGGGLSSTTADDVYVNVTGDTMTGPLVVPDGTALDPGVRLTSYAAGLFAPGSNTLGFSIAGSYRYNMTTGAFFPQNHFSANLGSTTKSFKNLYVGGIVAPDNALTLSATGATRDIVFSPGSGVVLPAFDVTTALGSAAKRWANVVTEVVNTDGVVSIGGPLVLSADSGASLVQVAGDLGQTSNGKFFKPSITTVAGGACAAPVACGGGTAGAMFYCEDSTFNKPATLCVCSQNSSTGTAAYAYKDAFTGSVGGACP